MNRNKFYLDELKNRLSPFAQIVLAKLLDLKKENSVCESTHISYNLKEQLSNRKVLIFDDFPSTLPDKQADIKSFDDCSNLGTQEIKNTGCISTSSNLLSPFCNDSVSYTKLLNPKTKSPELTNPIVYGTTSTYGIKDSIDDKKENDSEDKHSVHWNELFDKDFFNDFDDYNISKDIILQEEDKDNTNNASLSFASKNLQSKELKINDLIGKTTIASKRKNNTPVGDKAQKVKKIQKENTRSYRKEKYTKTVKNWLSHVDNDVKETTNIDDNNVHREKDEDKRRKPKKTIQAQLANKGGIMKFAKPNETELTIDSIQCLNNQLLNPNKKAKPFISDVEASYSEKTLEVRNENTKLSQKKLYESNDEHKIEESANTKAKEKKVRSKFVAPVLTPLPVREVTYAVQGLYEHNISEHGKTLEILNAIEIIIVLVYSNGYSQLNVQYARASTESAPEGVMFLMNEQYYYIKQCGSWFAELICEILSKNTIVCFNAKEVLIFLMTHYDLSSCSLDIIDVKIGASLLSPEEPPETFSKLQKQLNTTSEFTIATECVLQKCAWYMSLLKDCCCSLRTLLGDGGLWRLFVEIEMKALPIIAEMELRGVCVNVDHLKSLDTILLSRMKEVEQRCYEAAGKSFQINSALQVRNILYEELQLDAKSNIKIRETICKVKSTSEAMLRSLTSEHPLPQLILEYRRLHKAHATFVAGILQHVRDGLVKPTWDQTAAVTGRIACNNPNLQAIPKVPFNFTVYPGLEQTEGRAAAAVSFRDAFVCQPGHVLLAADFRHAECRVFALAAADDALQRALRSGDLFAVLAARWLSKPEEAVSGEERERTKRIVYASLYGAGARKLAEILQIGYEQALAVLASFNRTFPTLKSFGREVVAACERQGGRLVTPGGRARTFSDISSDDSALRSHAERQAVNFIVQGSAADLCKAALVACARRLRSARPALAARLVLQLHDELVWELPQRELARTADVIKSAMEGCGELCGLAATFPVGLASGPRWGALTSL